MTNHGNVVLNMQSIMYCWLGQDFTQAVFPNTLTET